MEDSSQLAPGPYPELGVHLAQVPLDGAGAEEQAGADVRVREPVTGQLGDLTLLRGEIVARLCDAPAAPLASRDEFAGGALRERLHAHRREQLVRDVELGARVEATAFAPQPFAVQQMRAGELSADARSAEMVDRHAEPAIGDSIVGEQRPGTRFDAARPMGARGLCLVGQPVEGVGRKIGPAAARGRLDQLAQPPVLRDDLSILTGGRGGCECVLVAAEAVEEDRARVRADGHSDSLSASARLALRHLDEVFLSPSRSSCLATPRPSARRKARSGSPSPRGRTVSRRPSLRPRRGRRSAPASVRGR